MTDTQSSSAAFLAGQFQDKRTPALPLLGSVRLLGLRQFPYPILESRNSMSMIQA
jgi:hypothetical protein